MLNGAIAGLVAITAEPLTPSPFAAILIGGVGGLIAFYPFVYVEIQNITAPSGRNKNIIYSRSN